MSERIIGFIANLLPLYTGQEIDGRWCAVCLADGTVVAPVAQDGDDAEDDRVVVYWQGDRTRRTEVQGALVAGQALLRYIELRGIGRSAEELRRERDGLAEHFEFKTGTSLYLAEGYEESDLQRMLRTAVSKFGPAFVLAAVRKTFGF
jgi:hypothetical protein